jgi:surface protein
MGYMIYGCKLLTSFDVSNFNTGNVTNMEAMFQGCQSIVSIINNFDVGKVKYMKYLFYNCINLTEVHVDEWNTSNVTDMGYAFNNCQSLKSLDLSKWNVSTVFSFFAMFENCKSIKELNLSNFKTNNNTNMDYMFTNCTNLTLISMNDSDCNSVNRIISQLPTKNENDESNLYVNIVAIEDINNTQLLLKAMKESAELKYWNINLTNKVNILCNNRYCNVKLKNKKIKRIHVGNF